MQRTYKLGVIALLCLLVFLSVFSCAERSGTLEPDGVASTYSDDELAQIRRKFLDIVRGMNYDIFTVTDEEYDAESNVFTMYAISRFGDIKAKGEVDKAIFVDGVLTSPFSCAITYWNGEEYADSRFAGRDDVEIR